MLNWQVVKIPGFRPIDLEGYWGRKSFGISCYMLRKEDEEEKKAGSSGSNGLHSKALKDYYFSIQIERVWENATNADGSKNNGTPLCWPEEEEEEEVRRSNSITNDTRRVDVEMTYEHRGRVNVILIVDGGDGGDGGNSGGNSGGDVTSAVSVDELCAMVDTMKLMQSSTSSSATTSTSHHRQTTELYNVLTEMNKCKPHNTKVLMVHQQELQRAMNRIIGTTLAGSTTHYTEASNTMYDYLLLHPIAELFTVNNTITVHRSTTMCSSSTLCCAVASSSASSSASSASASSSSPPNYWRAGHMCLDKNQNTSVVSIMVFCTKTSVPILIIPISSITKVIQLSNESSHSGCEMQICTTSRSHGYQLFTFVVGTEQLCEEWTEIIRAKACL